MNYVARISNVREVVLVGSSDPGVWEGVLGTVGLRPAYRNGRAEVMLAANRARFRGIRFGEFIVAVAAARKAGDGNFEGYYLAKAYQTSRFFAFVERHRFRTPYSRAAIDIRTDPPASFTLTRSGYRCFHAAMGDAREPDRREPQSWQLPIFLPFGIAYLLPDRYVFGAQVSGPTDVYPFDPATDSCTISFGMGDGGLGVVRESRFRPLEWRVRTDADHARSKTWSEPMTGVDQ